jgi:hypothetical protein
MARIRTIKPSFWGDEAVTELSREARLTLIGLISSADDQGRFMASHAVISGYVFPYDGIPPAKLRQWLDEIEATGIVEFYKVGRREYGWFPKWKRHQRISKPAPSPLPAPPSFKEESA